MRAVVFSQHGDPSVLEVVQQEPPLPGRGQAVVHVAASGINFVDVYQRTGAYPMSLPATAGNEGAGTIAALGEGVEGLAVGDQVAWTSVPGSHREQAVVPADRLVPVPDGIPSETAAAALLQGVTAHYLTRTTYRVAAGDTVLVHAAAGGMGLLLTRLATHLGARVVATASTEHKRDLALDAGASVAVHYADALEAVFDATAGRGVDAVFDGVGRDTFETSLSALRTRGMLVLFGSASGPVPPFDPQRLGQAGSIVLTRPRLDHFIERREELLERASEVFDWIAAGTLPIEVGGRYPLERVREAYTTLESRQSTGKLLLIP